MVYPVPVNMRANIMKRPTTMIVILSLAGLLVLGLFAAGCTSNGTTTTVATTVPASSPTGIATMQAPVSTTGAPITTTAPVSTGQKETIRISGSTTVLPIVQKAADQYMAVHPEADIQISGGGSGVGIQAIGARTVDIGMTSREVTKDEMAKYPGICRYNSRARRDCRHCEPGKRDPVHYP